MLGSLACQKLHYSAPNGFPCLNQTIYGRAPRKSEINPERCIVGGKWGVKGPADTRPHSNQVQGQPLS